jgi:hypothetical protein
MLSLETCGPLKTADENLIALSLSAVFFVFKINPLYGY